LEARSEEGIYKEEKPLWFIPVVLLINEKKDDIYIDF